MVAPEIIERKMEPKEAAARLRSTAISSSSAADEARYMMHQYHRNTEAHAYWCAVVYQLESSDDARPAF